MNDLESRLAKRIERSIEKLGLPPPTSWLVNKSKDKIAKGIAKIAYWFVDAMVKEELKAFKNQQDKRR